MDIIGKRICFRRSDLGLSKNQKTFCDIAMAIPQNVIRFASTSMDVMARLPRFRDNVKVLPRSQKSFFDRAMALRQNAICF